MAPVRGNSLARDSWILPLDTVVLYGGVGIQTMSWYKMNRQFGDFLVEIGTRSESFFHILMFDINVSGIDYADYMVWINTL